MGTEGERQSPIQRAERLVLEEVRDRPPGGAVLMATVSWTALRPKLMAVT